jgi:hypothetical protein
MGNPVDSRQVRYGYAEQSAFATPIAVDQAFSEVSVEPTDFNQDVMIHEVPKQHGTQQPVQQMTEHSVQGSSANFSVNGPLDLNDIDQFLYAHFQDVIELADTEFTKTFTYFTTHPDFAADEGHFLTWIKRFPDASTSQHVGGCICPRIKISGERDGLLMFESDWQGLGTTDNDADPSGTWTPRDGTDLVDFNSISSATLTRGAGLTSPVSISMNSFEVEGVQEYSKIGHDATNGFESAGLSERGGSFKIEILRDAVVQEAIQSLEEGEMVQLDIDVGSLLSITVNGKVEANEYNSEGLLMATLTCRTFSTYTAGSVSESLQIVVGNSVDRSWPSS